MKKSVITVSVHMDYKTLREFSMFDTFVLKKHWIRPAVFGAIFLIFAVVCFAAAGKEQNWLLGTVMLLIGLGMPAVYVGMFLSGVKGQAKKLKLPRKVYTLTFSKSGVHISNDLKPEEQVDLEWQKIPAAFRCMKDKGGVIINAASFAALIPSAGSGAYAASKAAIHSLTKSLAAELAPFNIRVNDFIPGVIHTPMNDKILTANGDKLAEQMAMRRLGKPDDVAQAMLYLAEAEFVTGQVLPVNGGFVI